MTTFRSRSLGLAPAVPAGAPDPGPQRFTFAGYAVRLPSGRIVWHQFADVPTDRASREAARDRAVQCMNYLGLGIREASRVVRIYAEVPE